MYYQTTEQAVSAAMKIAPKTQIIKPVSEMEKVNTGTIIVGLDEYGCTNFRVRETYDNNFRKCLTVSYSNEL